MESSKRVLVLGARGCGKSSLISALTNKKPIRKMNKLRESTFESASCSMFMGEKKSLQLLEAEGAGIHYTYKASVILVLFDSRSLKSQKESTEIFNTIQNHLQKCQTKTPVIAVFTKCSEDSLIEYQSYSEGFRIMPTDTETKFGLDAVKLAIYKLAFPEIRPAILVQQFRNMVQKVTGSTIKSLSPRSSSMDLTFSKRRMLYRCGSSPSSNSCSSDCGGRDELSSQQSRRLSC